MAHRRIGQVLVDMGFITDEQQELLVDEQHEHPGQLLGKVAIDMGLINEEQLAQALGEQLSLQVTTVAEITIKKDVLAMVTAPMAQMYRIMPIEFDGDTLTVAMCDPQNLSVQDELRTFLGFNIRVVVTTESSMNAAQERYYGESTDSVESIVSALEDDAELAAAAAGISADGPINLDDVTALADSAPVRKLLNMVLLMAIREHASDLHFEPFEDEFKIRIKADGVLYEMVPPPRHLAFAITTRIKVMANLDIAERRLPQDGRIELTVGGHPVDLRVSVLPTMFGESVVMRVLDRSVTSLDLNSVGMNAATLEIVPRRHREAERHRARDGADGFRQNDDALFGAQRAEQHRRQADHDRGPGRVRHGRHHPGADRSRTSAIRLVTSCDPFFGRTRTRFWSARFAIWKRPRSPCRRRSRGTSCSARCTRTTRRARSRG